MLMIVFAFLMILVFGKMVLIAIKACWGISKIMVRLILLPLALIGLVLKGLVIIALPVVLIIGILLIMGSRV